MMVPETLQVAKDDLLQLRGKKVDLTRQAQRLNSHREVFQEQLERIENELSSVESELDEINKKCRSATKQITWLRLKMFCQLSMQCGFYVYSFLSFLLINLLNVLYVALVLCANLTKAVLETQIAAHSSSKTNAYEDQSCLT